jgi:hypothetical protein
VSTKEWPLASGEATGARNFSAKSKIRVKLEENSNEDLCYGTR